MEKQIIIHYWRGTQLSGLKYKHNSEIGYDHLVELIEEVIEAGYTIMLRPFEANVVAYIGTGKLSQS